MGAAHGKVCHFEKEREVLGEILKIGDAVRIVGVDSGGEAGEGVADSAAPLLR